MATGEATDDMNITGVLPAILATHVKVTLSVDLMHVNGLPFLVTISKNIKFGTVSHLRNKQPNTIVEALTRVCNLYHSRHFQVVLVKADHEFESCRQQIESLHISLNVTAWDEHVGEVERYIRTVKERTREVFNLLPFQRIPACLVAELVMSQVFWLNAFPVTDGISDRLSRRYILTGVDRLHTTLSA